MCDVIDLIDKYKPIKDPFLREFIQDSNFIAFCNVFEPTKVYESDDSAGTLNKKIALLILGGPVNHRLYKLDKVFDLKNKFFIRLKVVFKKLRDIPCYYRPVSIKKSKMVHHFFFRKLTECFPNDQQ